MHSGPDTYIPMNAIHVYITNIWRMHYESPSYRIGTSGISFTRCCLNACSFVNEGMDIASGSFTCVNELFVTGLNGFHRNRYIDRKNNSEC